jgi:hypothetical protein
VTGNIERNQELRPRARSGRSATWDATHSRSDDGDQVAPLLPPEDCALIVTSRSGLRLPV